MTVSVPDDKLNYGYRKAVQESLNWSCSLENYHTIVHVFALDVFLCNVS